LLYAGIILVLCAVLLASCTTQPKVDENKVHLVFSTFLKEEVFNSQIKQPVEAKFPEIELRYDWENSFITEGLSNAREIGDIRHSLVRDSTMDVDYIPDFPGSGFFDAEDLTPYIESNQLDISHINRKIWNHAESLQTHGELAILPYSRKLLAMYYNKQIFDKYGVEYPRDGMTWNEVLALARQLPSGVRLDLSINAWINLVYQLGIDWQDHTGNLQGIREKWMRIVALYEEVAGLPGYRYWQFPMSASDRDNGYMNNFEHNEIAMSISPYWYITSRNNYRDRRFILQDAVQAGIDMDVVTYPVFADYPNQQPVRIEQALQLNADSTHKEEAFRVMAYLLSGEHQLSISKQGVGSVLDNADVKESFAAAVPEVQDRNVMAYFPPSRTDNLKKGQLLEAYEVRNKINGISLIFTYILMHRIDAENAIEQIMEYY